MKSKQMPKIIHEVGFDFRWEEKKVWKLEYPAENIPITRLSWHFTIPFWSTAHGYYDLTPNEVINHPKKHPEEYQRTMNADLSHPIDVMENKGRLLILDGLHRLVKAKILEKTTVSVRIIPRKEIPYITA